MIVCCGLVLGVGWVGGLLCPGAGGTWLLSFRFAHLSIFTVAFPLASSRCPSSLSLSLSPSFLSTTTHCCSLPCRLVHKSISNHMTAAHRVLKSNHLL